MDPRTTKLAIELQLADIDDLLDGLYDVEVLPEGDARTSLQLMRSSLQEQLRTLEDQIFILKILKQEHDDRVAYARLVEEEKQAASDHALALRLAKLDVKDTDRVRRASTATDSSGHYEGLDSESEQFEEGIDEHNAQWNIAKELYAAVFEHDIESSLHPNSKQNVITKTHFNAPGPSARPGVRDNEAFTKCVACMEVVPNKDTLTLACQPKAHAYCRLCLKKLFTSAIHESTLFPPRCCKVPIPIEICRLLLPKELIKAFDIKTEELATPNPTYCSNVDCAKFITAIHIKADVGDCVFCGHQTCAKCKCAKHEGLCPKDPHVKLLMDVAKRSKWQQCTKCKNMVELAHGCFHMM